MDRKKARELLIKSRIYKYVSWFCAGVGLLVFMALYQMRYNGKIAEAIVDPQFIAIILVPFIPAFITLRVAGHAEKKLAKELGTDNENA